MTDVIEWLKAAPSHVDIAWQARKAEAIRGWCMRQLGLQVGDRVRLIRDQGTDPTSGWYCYREALTTGATATIRAIDFNPYSRGGEGAWHADIRLDREWSVGTTKDQPRFWAGPADETPEGYTPPSPYDRENYPAGRKHTFSVLAEDVEVIPDDAPAAGDS